MNISRAINLVGIIFILNGCAVLSKNTHVSTDCQLTIDNSKKVGAVVGTAAGAGIGALVAGKNNRMEGAAVGAVVGGISGFFIGDQIGKRDQACVNKAILNALNNKKSQSFSNPNTGVSANVNIKQSYKKNITVQVPKKILASKPENLPPYDLTTSGKYQLKNTANVRVGPGTNYKVAGKLNGGTKVDIIGQVSGKPWLILGNNSPVEGFVYSKLLTYKGTLFDSNNQETDLASLDVTTTCTLLDVDISKGDSAPQIEQKEYCKGPNGWVLD